MSRLCRCSYLFLLIPLNTVAHPGHDGIVIPSSADDFINLASWIAIALLASLVPALLIRRATRTKTENVNE